MESKACRLCGEVKPLDEFHRAEGMRDGHRNECRSCTKSLRRAHYESNRERYIQAAQRWQARNPERTAAYQAEYRNRPERKRAMRDLYYRRTYGISADEVDAMLEGQGGGCAICGQRPDRPASLHLDHDHLTGTLRGILCIDCNHGIGKLRDDPELLARAIGYLRRTRRPSLGRSVASLAAV
jgi:hypothetical protein